MNVLKMIVYQSMDAIQFLNEECHVILASSSEPRAALLRQVGLRFQAISSNFAEDFDKSQFSPRSYALMNAQAKAAAVAEICPDQTTPTLIIGSDSIVVAANDQILEKCRSDDEAREMIRTLSGKSHSVVTAVSILMKVGKIKRVETNFVDATQVQFHDISFAEVEAYLETGEHQNKCGSYGIQGVGALFVKRIDGDFTTVIGLPLGQTLRKLRELIFQ